MVARMVADDFGLMLKLFAIPRFRSGRTSGASWTTFEHPGLRRRASGRALRASVGDSLPRGAASRVSACVESGAGAVREKARDANAPAI